MESAKVQMNAPFTREAELKEKEERLKELNILLNMDEKDRSLMDDMPKKKSAPTRNRGLAR